MGKYSIELKLSAVQDYINGSESIRAVANKFKIPKTALHQWVKKYEYHGINGLNDSYTDYSQDFKMDVLKYINDTGASCEEASAVFNISHSVLVRKWKYLFETLGEDAINVKPEERPPTMKKQPNEGQPVEGSDEALRAEIERLRMENAYLKKLAALVQEKKRLQNKKKHR